MFFVALAYMAGLTLGRLFLLPSSILLVGAIGIAAVTGWGLLGKQPGWPFPRQKGTLLLLALILLGWNASNGALHEEMDAVAQAERLEGARLARVRGTVTSVERLSHRGLKLRLRNPMVQAAGEDSVPFRLAMDAELLYFSSGFEGGARSATHLSPEINQAFRLLPGAEIQSWVRVQPDEPLAHPWDFDTGAYHRHQGVGASFGLPDLALLEQIAPPSKPRAGLNALTATAREHIRRQLDRHAAPESAALARAMAVGERSAMSRRDRAAFQDAGLTHLLVVSGLHTGFILLVALVLARLLGLPPAAWAIAGLIALGVFLLLVGFRPPVVRASIMGAFLLGAWGLGRTSSTLAGLATAAFVTLLIDPRNLIRPDWQLSYACVLSLTLLMPPLVDLIKSLLGLGEKLEPDADFLYRVRFFLYRRVGIPVAGVGAILMGLLPLQVVYFGQVNLSTTFSNIVAIPLTWLTMMETYALALMGGIAPIASMIGVCLEVTTGALRLCAATFADPELIRIRIPAASPILMLLYSLALLGGSYVRAGENPFGRSSRLQRRAMTFSIGAFFLLLAWVPLLPGAEAKGLLELYVVDVGQGDALVLRSPQGDVGVIDGGGGRDGGEGERTLVPFLEGLGVTRLAFVAATHADADHVGGLDAVVESFDVSLVLVGPHRAETQAWREFATAVNARRSRVQEVRAGDRIEGWPGLELTVLGPFPDQSGNDASIVMLLDYGNVEILLTGDMEAAAEQRLLSSGKAVDIDILKVAHHGSRTSSTEAFLESFRPEVALISAGRNNAFGHPAPQVVERLHQRGILVGRTDLHGTLRVRTDGRRIQLARFGKEARDLNDR